MHREIDIKGHSNDLYKGNKEWQMLSDFISHPRYMTIDRFGRKCEECVPLEYSMADQIIPDYTYAEVKNVSINNFMPWSLINCLN